MCGIAGFVGFKSKNESDLHRMLETIVHRGPNSAGTHIAPPVFIGMRRLSIIDLEGGDQPICNKDRNIWTVSNGEIYNYKQIRATLRSLGHQFRTDSDTEVIVHAYVQWGDSFVDHLEGMFGTAIWDARKQRLLLLRDRLGIKTLYYSETDGGLAFGSEMKCLFAGGFASPEIDGDALQEYLAFGYSVAPNCIASGVKKIAPGEMLIWEAGRVTHKTYWSLPQKTISGVDVQDWCAETMRQFENAISSHLVSDVPLGSFLSGGIDSSGIVGVMDRFLNNPVNTYAIGYRGSDAAAYFNELPFAAEVARDYRSNHREIEVNPNVTELLPKLMWHLEEPISDTATMTTYLVSQMARETVTVIMSGVGGDELFAGYRRYLGDYYLNKYVLVPRWLRNHLVEPLVRILPNGRANRLQDLGRYAQEFVRTAELSWDEQYRGYLAISSESQVKALSNADSRARNTFQQVCAEADTEDPLLRLMTVDLKTQLPEALLLLSDKMTMACSLECRVPFLHHPFVEFASSVPSEIKMPNGNLKNLLKETLAEVLPDSVLNRRKRGFGAPVGSWLQGEIAPLVNQLLCEKNLKDRGLFEPSVVADILNKHRNNKQDYTDLIMVLMNVELWCRLFQDNRTPEDVATELRSLCY